MLKSDIIWPEHRRYKSRTEWEPIGFFSDCLCNTTHFDLMLGFFSSSAISVLANGFAVFLYNGGRMRLIVNDILTEEDKNAIADGASDVEIPYFDVSDIQKIKEMTDALISNRAMDFLEQVKLAQLKEFICENANDEFSNYLYENYYVKNQPEAAQPLLNQINSKYGAKVFLADIDKEFDIQ